MRSSLHSLPSKLADKLEDDLHRATCLIYDGDASSFLPNKAHGQFLRMFIGPINVRASHKDVQFKVKGEYNIYRDRTALLFLLFPSTLLILRYWIWDECLPAFPVQLYQGHLDMELNDVGRQQAATVADQLSKEETISVVYSSDLKRTFETASIIANRPGVVEDLEPYIQRITDGDTSPILTGKTITTISLREENDNLWRAAKEEIVEMKISFEGFAIAVRLGQLPLCIEVLCFVVA
ncbi:hypothetical protein QYF36_020092 [Acer negundo]|nr:hypothetical protein QYF36_020092 [Acer negundo]